MSVKKIAFLVPIKKFSKAKSRLTSIFPVESRFEMQETIGLILFRDLMDTLEKIKGDIHDANISVIICSKEAKIKEYLEKIQDPDFIFLDESTMALKDALGSELHVLDEIIDMMNQHAIHELHADASILLMGDMPLLGVETMNELFSLALEGLEHPPRVVLSPSVGNGCNMVIRVPPAIMKTNYSSVSPSFINNLIMAKSLAKKKGIPVEEFIQVCKNLDLYLDLDMPEDLISIYPLLKELKPNSHTCKLFDKMKLEIQNVDGNDNRNLNFTFKGN